MWIFLHPWKVICFSKTRLYIYIFFFLKNKTQRGILFHQDVILQLFRFSLGYISYFFPSFFETTTVLFPEHGRIINTKIKYDFDCRLSLWRTGWRAQAPACTLHWHQARPLKGKCRVKVPGAFSTSKLSRITRCLGDLSPKPRMVHASQGPGTKVSPYYRNRKWDQCHTLNCLWFHVGWPLREGDVGGAAGDLFRIAFLPPNALTHPRARTPARVEPGSCPSKQISESFLKKHRLPGVTRCTHC